MSENQRPIFHLSNPYGLTPVSEHVARTYANEHQVFVSYVPEGGGGGRHVGPDGWPNYNDALKAYYGSNTLRDRLETALDEAELGELFDDINRYLAQDKDGDEV